MKTFVRSLALALGILSAAPALAQTIPNAGFENWVQRRGVEAPQGWLTIDDFIANGPQGGGLPSSGTVLKSTDRRSGNFAVRMETKSFLGQLTLPGAVVLGDRISNPDIPGGIPYTSRPARLQLYYKLTGAAAVNDSALVQVFLTRTVNGEPQLVGAAVKILDPQASFGLLDLPFQYAQTNAPDSLRITLASGIARNITVGTTLIVDDVALVGGTQSTQDAALLGVLSVFPNPSASGLFTVTARGREKDLAASTFTVSDALGRTVLQRPAGNDPTARTLDLSAQPAGLYTLRLDTPTGYAVQKLVKQ